MAKLYFRYSAMNAGKSTALMQVAHNYSERDMTPTIIKPAVDTKSGSQISSRIGISRETDFVIQPDDDLGEILEGIVSDCILIDEAQFLTSDQVDSLWRIALEQDIPVICYGIRTDFVMQGFGGSTRLLEIAHSIEELKTICRCGKKALYNMRLVDGTPVFDGHQIAIDGVDVSYDSVCGSCFLRHQNS